MEMADQPWSSGSHRPMRGDQGGGIDFEPSGGIISNIIASDQLIDAFRRAEHQSAYLVLR